MSGKSGVFKNKTYEFIENMFARNNSPQKKVFKFHRFGTQKILNKESIPFTAEF